MENVKLLIKRMEDEISVFESDIENGAISVLSVDVISKAISARKATIEYLKEKYLD